MKIYKIVDFSTLLPGPFASFLLTRFGFEVTKVEDSRNADLLRRMQPTEGGISVFYKAINKTKKIIDIDYRSGKDIETIKQLITESDVVIENFKPGRMDKFGLSFEDCRKINPNILYCSITSFGKNHPWQGKPVHDLNILGLTGYLSFFNNVQIPSLPLADFITSYEVSLQVLAHLLQSRSTHLTISMFETFLQTLTLIHSAEAHLKRSLKREEFLLWGSYPCYRLYNTEDNKYMALAALEPAFWADFCTAVNLVSLVDKQFDTSEEVRKEIEKKIAGKSQKYWLEAKINTFTPVLTYHESKKLGLI